MKVTEETIESLIKNASNTVRDLYPAMKQDIDIMHKLDNSVSSLLRLVPELRMDVEFILVDLSISFQALISGRSAIEKRLNIKNLRADMHEIYKLLYGYGKSRKYTIWSKIGFELKNRDDGIYVLLKNEYNKITQEIENLEITDKNNRDLTYHYDDDLLNVYQNILDSFDEEGACRNLISIFDLLRRLLMFCDVIVFVEELKGYSLPRALDCTDSNNYSLKLFAEILSDNKKLQGALTNILNGASKVDDAARMRKGIVQIKIISKEKYPQFDLPEANVIDILLNTQLLIQIMLVDIATIINAYLNSGAEPEYSFNLKRLLVTRVSVLSHLVGYEDNERNRSLWTLVCTMIPETDELLLKESQAIYNSLETLINPRDKTERTLFAHLMDKKKNNIPAIIAKMEKMNPLAELKKAEVLLIVTSQVQTFIKDLMDKLAHDAHEKALDSSAKLMNQVNNIRQLMNNSQCPDSLRDTIINRIDILEKLAKGDFIFNYYTSLNSKLK